MNGLEDIAGNDQSTDQPKSTRNKNHPAKWQKGKSGNPHGRKARLSDAGGLIDLLAEFEWRLANPNEPAKTPPQKMVLNFYRTDFPNWVAQYNELKRADLDKRMSAERVAGATDSGGKLEPTEADLTIDEAIDRVLQQLEEMEHEQSGKSDGKA